MPFFADKLKVPTPEQALPGRPERMRVPKSHFVNGAPLEPPFPEGTELALFGLGCFWGAERKFWQVPGVVSTSVGYAGGSTPNPSYEEVCSGRTGHTEVVRVVFDPRRVAYAELLRVFWEAHDPTQGMRQGNDVGTQYRSAIYTYGDEQARAAAAPRARLRVGARRGRPRGHHHRDRSGARVLLRRGLSPAVPREEPGRLLRHRRHRRRLPDWSHRAAVRLSHASSRAA